MAARKTVAKKSGRTPRTKAAEWPKARAKAAERPKARVKTEARVLPRAQVATAVRTFAAPSGTPRFAAGKALAATAEHDVRRVLPHFDAVAALLDSQSKVVCWNAIQILGHLAAADAEHKFDGILDRFLGFIGGENMITAANVVQAAGRIACARPELWPRIVAGLLEVESATYKTPECRNVVIGHVLAALEQNWERAADEPAVAAFVRRQVRNPRAPVAQHAARLVARLK